MEAHEGKIWGINNHNNNNNNNKYDENGAEFGFTLPLYNENI